jgi:cobalt-zinc-cadmium efflux system membrane fusion protein
MKLAITMLVLAAGALGAGCPRDRAEPAPKKEAEREASGDRVTLTPAALAHLKLTYAKAEERELTPALEVTGELVPDADGRAEIGARVAGRVVDVRVKIGDRVARGTPLVALESAEVGRARADRLAATARLESARRTFERRRALVGEGVTATRELEEAERELRVAEAEVAAARTRLATFGAAPDERNPAWVVLRSPISGTVVARTVYVGRWAEPAKPLVEVVDLDKLWLLASVYEREVRYVARGQDVNVEVRAFPGEVFTGRVEHVGDTIDEKTRTVTVRVSLPNPGHRLAHPHGRGQPPGRRPAWRQRG